jgi:hypothetical protein
MGMVFRGWQTSLRTYRMGGWTDMDPAVWARIFNDASTLTVMELEGLISGLKGLSAARRTAAQRRAVVARNQRLQGIEVPRQRDPQSEFPDQSLETGSSGSKPQ